MYNKFVAGCVLLSIVVVGVVGQGLTETELQAIFTEWGQKNGKSYTTSQFLQKYQTFKSNHAKMVAHNADPDALYKRGLNKFSDLTFDEFASTHLGLRPAPQRTAAPSSASEVSESNSTRAGRGTCPTGSATCGTGCCSTAANAKCVSGQCRTCNSGYTFCGTNMCCPSGYTCTTSNQCISCGSSRVTCPNGLCCPSGYTCDSTGCKGAQVPTGSPLSPNVNWTSSGYVTPVKDQGQCGSCWSFSSTGAIEAAYNKKHTLTGTSRVVLSEQNLLDCVTASSGCNGGWPTDAMNYVKANGGIASTAAYPLTSDSSGVAGTCKYTASMKAAAITGSTVITGESALESQVAIQPVSIAIKVVDSLYGYANGVYNDPACAATTISQLNHAVLVVGYGTDPNAGAYWIVKNSWGTGFGRSGYFLLQKGKGACGVGLYGITPAAA